MRNLALLLLRLTVGTLLAGHGAQKLFGWFGGHGLKGTHGFMEMMGMKPGKVWGTMAALSEFGGGVLTVLGFLNPLGPLSIVGTMVVAIKSAHWGKPIWASQGGAELPLTNLAAAGALVLMGPGDYSLDHALGIRMPRLLTALLWLGGAGMTATVLTRPEMAQTVLDRVTGAAPAAAEPPEPQADTVVETRRRTGEAERTPEESPAAGATAGS